MMDNILKTILAVIGISALIAFVMSDMPAQNAKQGTVAIGGDAPAQVQNAPEFQKSEQPKPVDGEAPAYVKQDGTPAVTSSQSITVDASQFGQPMMNPEPSIKFQDTSAPKTDSVSAVDKPSPEQSAQGT